MIRVYKRLKPRTAAIWGSAMGEVDWGIYISSFDTHAYINKSH
jgi:hypothetical protein